MPPLTKEQLDQVKYVSVKDYCQKVDQIESLEDKLEFSARYILSYGQGGNAAPDYPIAHIIKVAHMKIADKSADIKEFYQETEVNKRNGDRMVDPTVKFAGRDLGNQMFIANPVGYLKGKAQALEKEISEKEWKNESDIQRYANYGRLRQNVFTDELSANVKEAIKKPTSFDVRTRLENAFGGPKAFKKAMDATKSGVLSRLFGKSSVASKNLDAAYKSFNNPNSVYYGDLPTIEKAATEYLQHVLPSWKPNRLSNIPKPEDIANLSGTQKARALLSINLLNASKEQRKMELDYKGTIEFAEEKNIAFSDIPVGLGDKIIIVDDNSFQENVAEDLDKAEESVIEQPSDEKIFEQLRAEPSNDLN